MKFWQFRRFIIMVLVCCLLTGCTLTERLGTGESSSTEEIAETSNRANYFGLTYYAGEQINPVLTKTDMNRVLVDALYESMVYLDENFQAQPMLSETWEGDGTVFSFHLKEGVTFWSGEPLTADDVVYTLKTVQSHPTSQYYARMTDVSQIYAEDELTVCVILKTPNVDFPKLMDIPIFRTGTETQDFSDGTGAYYPVQENGSWHLEPYQNWHGGTVGMFQKITLVSTTRTDAAARSFETGDISLLRTERIGTDAITVSGTVDIYKLPTTCMHYLGFAAGAEPYSVPEVRQAISLAMDRQGVCTTQLQSFATPSVLPVNPQPEQEELTLNMQSDREAAIAILQSAGITDENGDGKMEYTSFTGQHYTLTPTILVNNENQFKVSAAQQIAVSLTAIGIRAQVEAVPFEEYEYRLQTGNFEIYYGEVRMTPDFDLRQMLCTGGALNYGRYSNVQTETLIAQARADETAKTALYEHLLTQMPIAPIAFARDQVIVRSNLMSGFSPAPNWLFHGVGGWRKN